MLEVLGTLAIYTFFISVIVLTSFALHYLHLLILCMKNRNDNNDNNESLNSSYFPKVTVQIPIYNEYYVVERIIDSVVKFDYPKDCLEIQVLDDSTDKTSELAEESVKFHRDQGINIKFLHRTERVGFKAGALGEGLKIAEGELIAIFDADFMPEEDFLRKTVPFFKNSNIGV